MGTSSSYRAPARPRWSAFIAALTSKESLERVRSELFNAGDEWEEAFTTAAVATYAASLAELYDDLPRRLARSESVDQGIVAILADVRSDSAARGFSPATAIAERALIRLILKTVGGVHAPDDSAAAVGERWGTARGGSAAELIARFAGELVGQYARHVIDREAGRLATEARGTRAPDFSAALAESAAILAEGAARRRASEPVDSGSWAALIRDAFEDGRALPGGAA